MNLKKLPRYAGACLRALFGCRPRSYLKLLSRSPYTVKNLSGLDVSMIVDVRDPAISRPILALGEYEASVTEVFLALARKNTSFLDIGANIGFFTLLAAEAMPDGRIWSVEPDPSNVRILRANVALNGFQDRVNVSHAAASDADGEVFFSSLGHDANIGARFTAKEEDTLLARSLPGSPSPTKVRALTADTLLREERVGLVKIDVEGHEPPVLAGMQRILEEDRPMIVSEFAPGTIEHISKIQPSDYLTSIASHRYVFAIIENDASMTLLGSETDAVLSRFTEEGKHHIDLMLLPEEKADQALNIVARCGRE